MTSKKANLERDTLWLLRRLIELSIMSSPRQSVKSFTQGDDVSQGSQLVAANKQSMDDFSLVKVGGGYTHPVSFIHLRNLE